MLIEILLQALRRIVDGAFRGDADVSSSAQGLLIRAVEKYGAAELGERLHISQMTLRALVTGIAPIPDRLLLRAMDLLTEPSSSAAASPAAEPKSAGG